jgi:hypothetical protein
MIEVGKVPVHSDYRVWGEFQICNQAVHSGVENISYQEMDNKEYSIWEWKGDVSGEAFWRKHL